MLMLVLIAAILTTHAIFRFTELEAETAALKATERTRRQDR